MGTRQLPCSTMGAANRFPRFRFEFEDIVITPDKQLPAKFRDQLFVNGQVSLFPYTPQSTYDRSQQLCDLPCVFLENEFLKVTVYPQYGGRVASVFDKQAERELLFDNPVFQPANLAIRDAWFSGGIEWNGPIYGHSLLTCSDVYVARIASPAGEGLRIYEFDRSLHTTWQVDLHLDNDAPHLWIHVRVTNVSDKDADYYWWTNVAVPETDETRVLASTKNQAVSHTADQRVAACSFPEVYDFDGSYPARYPRADSIFFDLHEDRMPWIASVDQDGRGLVYTSSRCLCGRKFFVWGSNAGGRRWTDFLSQEGGGRYIEIQGGLQPSQLQTIPLPRGQQLEWTECISPLAVVAADAHHEDYMHATGVVQQFLDHADAESMLNKQDAQLSELAGRPVIENIWRGSAWGRLFEQLRGQALATGMTFDGEASPAEQWWQDLLDGRSPDAATAPGDWVQDQMWTNVLQRDVDAGRANWQHFVLLAAAAIQRDEFDQAQHLLQQANADRESSLAWRLQAVLHMRAQDVAAGLGAYAKAWDLEQYADLAVVYARAMWTHGERDACAAFLNSLAPELRCYERIQILLAEIALEQDDLETVERILEQEFAGIREGEVILSDLWYSVQIRRKEQQRGCAFSAAEIERFKTEQSPPKQIDFRMLLPQPAASGPG